MLQMPLARGKLQRENASTISGIVSLLMYFGTI
jgi:hypothetical protein